MRILITCAALTFMFSTITTTAEAQLGKRLKDRAKNAAARKAEDKIARELEKKAEQMVEKSWDTIFGEIEEGSKSEDGKGTRNSMFKFSSNVATEDSYRFDIVTTMEVKTERKKGKSEPPLILEMHFNENEMYTGTKYRGKDIDAQQEDVFIIYDFKNSAMIMLMKSEENQFSFAYDWQQALQNAEEMESTENENEEETNWDEIEEWKGYTKIGTKNIAGHSSDGYRSETEYGSTEIWVTRDLAYGMENMFRANANSKQLRGKVPGEYPYGMLMQMTSKDFESGDTVTMMVTDIDKNANIRYAMSDYPAMSLGKK